jgi:hypothetical protein
MGVNGLAANGMEEQDGVLVAFTVYRKIMTQVEKRMEEGGGGNHGEVAQAFWPCFQEGREDHKRERVVCDAEHRPRARMPVPRRSGDFVVNGRDARVTFPVGRLRRGD